MARRTSHLGKWDSLLLACFVSLWRNTVTQFCLTLFHRISLSLQSVTKQVEDSLAFMGRNSGEVD